MQVCRVVVVTLLACMAVACTTDVAGTATTSKPLPDAASLFNPCTDIPDEFMAELGLQPSTMEPMGEVEVNGVVWEGCNWIMPEGYGVIISATTLTIDLIRSRQFDGYREIVIDDRPAAVYHRLPSGDASSCVVDIELGSGAIDFSILNPPYVDRTGHLDACDLVRELASEVSTLFP